MGIGAPEMLVVLLLFLPAILCIWAAIDASSLPDAAFERAGTSKTLWIVLPVVGIFVCVVGLVAVVLWFTSFRGRVQAAASGA